MVGSFSIYKDLKNEDEKEAQYQESIKPIVAEYAEDIKAYEDAVKDFEQEILEDITSKDSEETVEEPKIEAPPKNEKSARDRLKDKGFLK